MSENAAYFGILSKQYLYEYGTNGDDFKDYLLIAALSEIYNVRVKFLDLNPKFVGQLTVIFSYGDVWDEAGSLPIITLVKNAVSDEYEICQDSNSRSMHKRPLGMASDRKDEASIRKMRLNDKKSNCLESGLFGNESESITIGMERKEEQRNEINKSSVAFARECCVCWENISNVAFIKCGHVCICKECSDDFDRRNGCPLCRKEIEAFLRIYL